MRVQTIFWTAVPNLMFPGLQPSRRELTPVRLCSVRLSWRQRARPSTTLHEIQICRSRLEYFVCITACGGPQPGASRGAEVVSTGRDGVGVLDGCRSQTRFGRGRQMKRYLKFAASFWMSAFLVAGSMAMAQTTPTPKPKKKSGSSTTSPVPAATTNNSNPTQSGTATTPTTSSDTTATTPAVTTNVQQSGTTTTAPKMIVGPDKHMIPAPQL
jgi:hypothetical protein